MDEIGQIQNRKALDNIKPYIPGKPLIITEDNLVYTRKDIEADLPVQGAEDEQLRTLRIIKEYTAFK